MIRKYKLVACLPAPLTIHPQQLRAHTYTETDSDPCHTAGRYSALLYQDLQWTAIIKYQRLKMKKTKQINK